MPVKSEAEHALVEGLFLGHIFDDETGVKDARAVLMRGGSVKAFAGLDEGERVAFGILESEALRAGFVFGEGAGRNFMSQKIFAHLREIGRREGNFGEQIVGCASGDLLEL